MMYGNEHSYSQVEIGLIKLGKNLRKLLLVLVESNFCRVAYPNPLKSFLGNLSLVLGHLTFLKSQNVQEFLLIP